jgi:DNA-binding MarR family transcriptional regulator
MRNKKMTDMSFAGLLGNDNTATVLELLIIGRNYQYNISELAKKTKISRPTMYKIIKRMIKQGLVIQTDKHFGIKHYKLNTESSEAKTFIKCFKQIISIS